MDTHFVNYRCIAQTTLDGTVHAPLHEDHDARPTARTRRSTTRRSGWPRRGPRTGRRSTRWCTTSTRAGDYQSGCTYQLRVLVQLDHERRLHELGRDLHQHGAPATSWRRSRTSSTKDGPERLLHAEQHRALGRRLVLLDVPRAQPQGAQQMGTCLMRTRDLSDPTSWRAWNGIDLLGPVRQPVHRDRSTRPTTSARRSTSTASGRSARASPTTPTSRSGCWSATRSATPANNKPPGVYYSLSDDLLNWTNAELLMAAEITLVRDCTLPDPIKESSILDPDQHLAELRDRRADGAAVLHLVPPERLQRHARPRPGPHPDPVQPFPPDDA